MNLRANILTTMFAFQTPARLLNLLHSIYSFENIGKKIEVHLQYSNLTVSCHVPRMGRWIGWKVKDMHGNIHVTESIYDPYAKYDEKRPSSLLGHLSPLCGRLKLGAVCCCPTISVCGV